MTAGSWWAVALAVGASCFAGLVVAAYRLGRLDGNGGHTHRNVRRRAADPFSDPADRSDPDGTGYVGQLLAAGRLPYVTDEADGPGEPDDSCQPDWLDEDELDAGWWAQSAPPDAVEVLTGPDRRIAQTAQLTTAVLNRVREGLAALEPDGTSAAFTPAPGIAMPVSDDPDTTGVQPVALRTWGKTAPELAAELAARYLT